MWIALRTGPLAGPRSPALSCVTYVKVHNTFRPWRALFCQQSARTCVLCNVCTREARIYIEVLVHGKRCIHSAKNAPTRVYIRTYFPGRAGVMQHGRPKRRTAYTCISVSSRSVVHQIQAGRAGIGAG